MKKIILLSTLSILVQGIDAQTPTWSMDVAPLIFENCSYCHHEGASGPFPLMSYSDAVENSLEIKHQVEDRHMPPWPADPDYRHFAYETILTDTEIETIVNWVLGGTPSGDLSQAPAAPEFNETGTQLNVIDFTIEMEPYTLQYNTDEYRWFAIENPYDETIYVNAIEIIPGLPAYVHHADLSYDLTGITANYDAQDPLSGFNGNTGSPNYSYYMNAWMAGGNVVRYPENWGIEVLPGSYFVFEIHYGPGGQGETDSTKMHLQFVTNTENVRPVYPSWLTNGPSEGGSYIPADEVSWYTQQTGIFWSEHSMISICPHQHYLGSSFKVWMETMEGDSVPLVHIPEWDFHWQMYYTFIHPFHIPIGSRIKTLASFDNTIYNEHNPNDPPEDVYWGAYTTDEMLMLYTIWSAYEEGDEEILMDSTWLNVPASQSLTNFDFQLYPNPANNHLYVSPSGQNWGGATIQFFDPVGQLILESEFDGGVQRFDVSSLPPAVYVVRMKKNNLLWNSIFIKE